MCYRKWKMRGNWLFLACGLVVSLASPSLASPSLATLSPATPSLATPSPATPSIATPSLETPSRTDKYMVSRVIYLFCVIFKNIFLYVLKSKILLFVLTLEMQWTSL